MSQRTFVGFGFGPIQAGLFLFEAFRSGNFRRLVVADVADKLVGALRAADGRYHVNVATRTGVETHAVCGVEICNPRDPRDRATLVNSIAEASEIATALPSIAFYEGRDDSVAPILAEGLARKVQTGGPRAIIYTAENDNHAAERLDQLLRARGATDGFACLNTVIGKMSGVVAGRPLEFLVESFNRILISRVPWPEVQRGIAVFEEKADLLPFEEAKLYGHNAIHALIGYELWHSGAHVMSDAAQDSALMGRARAAFLEESGVPLCRKYAGVDPLFTPEGFRAYVDDLLPRMVNPFLSDAVERVTRDPRRKLGWNDRLVGTMRLALGQGVEPRRFARAVRLALRMLAAGGGASVASLLEQTWGEAGRDDPVRAKIVRLIEEARDANLPNDV